MLISLHTFDITISDFFVSPGGFEPHILKSVAWCSIRWTMETICSQDRSRTCTIEKTNFIRFFGMVNIFNVMSHGPINQSPITRLPFRHLTIFGRPENYTIKIGFPIIFSFLVLPPILLPLSFSVILPSFVTSVFYWWVTFFEIQPLIPIHWKFKL